MLNMDASAVILAGCVLLVLCLLLVLCYLIYRCVATPPARGKANVSVTGKLGQGNTKHVSATGMRSATPPARGKANVSVTGKLGQGNTKHVSATGMRSDNSGDASKALGNIGNLNVLGSEGGTAGTVEATGLDLRRSQRRPEEGGQGQENMVIQILRILLPAFLRQIFGTLMRKRKDN